MGIQPLNQNNVSVPFHGGELIWLLSFISYPYTDDVQILYLQPKPYPEHQYLFSIVLNTLFGHPVHKSSLMFLKKNPLCAAHPILLSSPLTLMESPSIHSMSQNYLPWESYCIISARHCSTNLLSPSLRSVETGEILISSWATTSPKSQSSLGQMTAFVFWSFLPLFLQVLPLKQTPSV